MERRIFSITIAVLLVVGLGVLLSLDLFFPSGSQQIPGYAGVGTSFGWEWRGVTGAILAIAIYHLVLATINPEKNATVAFASFTLLVAFQTLQLPWTRVTYIAMTLTAPALLWYTHHVFPGGTNRNVRRFVFVAALVQCALALMLPSLALRETYVLSHILTVLSLGYVAVVTVGAIRSGEVGAQIAAIGFIVLLGSILNDVLFHQKAINTAYLLPIGAFGFLLAQATMIGVRFCDRFRQTLALQNGLEETVGVRTEELQRERNRLQHLVRYDELTELTNRRYGTERLTEEVARFLRYGQPLSIVLADIDHFKSINDIHGHQVGDETLRGFAEIIEQTTRSTDIVCRWGGEEFLLILPNTAIDEAWQLTQKLKETVGIMPIETRSGLMALVFSAGVTGVETGHSYSATRPTTESYLDTLLATADIALEEAKRAGGNVVRLHHIVPPSH